MTANHAPAWSGRAQCRDCDRTVKLDKWAKIRAGIDGWFFAREGWVTCPAHPPAWLHAWRNRDLVERADLEGLTLCELAEDLETE